MSNKYMYTKKKCDYPWNPDLKKTLIALLNFKYIVCPKKDNKEKLYVYMSKLKCDKLKLTII